MGIKKVKRRGTKQERKSKRSTKHLRPAMQGRNRSATQKASTVASHKKSGPAKASALIRYPMKKLAGSLKRRQTRSSNERVAVFPPESRRLHGKYLVSGISQEGEKGSPYDNMTAQRPLKGMPTSETQEARIRSSPTTKTGTRGLLRTSQTNRKAQPRTDMMRRRQKSSRKTIMVTKPPRVMPSVLFLCAWEGKEKGAGSPVESVSSKDRYNIAGILTCLFNKGEGHDKIVLKNMYARLKLSEAEQSALIARVGLTSNPAPFARAIRSEKVRWMVLSDLLASTIAAGRYDAREREGFRQVAAMLKIPWIKVTTLEDRLAEELRKVPPNQEPNQRESLEVRNKRRWKIAVAAVAAAVAFVAFTPLAAPAIGGAIGAYGLGLSGAAATSAGLAVLGGGSLAAGGFGMAGGTVTIAAALGLTGGGLVGSKVARRIGPVDEFRYVHLNGSGMHCFIAVPGFLSGRTSPEQIWGELPKVAGHGEHFALVWESQHLHDLAKALVSFSIQDGVGAAIRAFAKHASKTAARNFRWPNIVLNAAHFIDNPWSVAKDRAVKAAQLLTEDLKDKAHGDRPVTLIGFSLGARLIFHALEGLAESGDQATGIVDHVILMGGAFSSDARRWEKVRRIVSGRLVNAYCPNDWVLGFLYRAAELEFREIAGLHPVRARGVESIDVSHVINGHLANGHLAYGRSLERLLVHIGVDEKNDVQANRAV